MDSNRMFLRLLYSFFSSFLAVLEVVSSSRGDLILTSFENVEFAFSAWSKRLQNRYRALVTSNHNLMQI